MKKHFTAHIIFAATALASQQVWALGFGRAVSDAVLGQAFTFTVPINVEPGERLGLDCISTEVFYGDSPLLSSAVRSDLQRGGADNTWVLKITAVAPVEEPIIEVSVSAGCERRFTRRFSVFADPPTLGTTAAQVAATPAVAPPLFSPTPGRSSRSGATALPPLGSGTSTSSSSTGSSTSSSTSSSSQAAARAARRAARAASAAAAAAERPHVVRKGPTMALANELALPRQDVGNAGKPPARTAPAESARLVLDAGMPRLKLDMEEPVVPPTSLASGAGVGLADLDDPEARQLKVLEDRIQAIRHDKQVQQDQAARLQVELAEAQARSDWLPWLAGLLLLAIAGIVALWWRLRQQVRIAHSDWFNQSQLGGLPDEPPPPPEPPLEPATIIPALDPRVRRPSAPPAPAAAEPPLTLPPIDDAEGAAVPLDHSTTRPLDRQALAGVVSQEPAPRELSVEELLDLEQQADFFIALGQEDAAVDLLMSHLRSAGGQSPLPYTKLLEIYRRQGDRSAYERTRARFNRRFNAYAPDWDTGPASGRTLEDYPETVALLEGAWASPIDAMAILEGLLFKRDDTSELFDLPAYRDVLVLYSLARDLWQHGGGESSTQVDVLLPLGDEHHPTQPVPMHAYPSAREVNDLALPGTDPGLDLDSVDVEGDTGMGLLTNFGVSGFEHAPEHKPEPARKPAGSLDGGRVELDLPPISGEHAGPGELSLAPVEPVQSKPSPLDWSEGEPSERPTKR